MYQLDLSAVKAQAGDSQAWSSVSNPSFSTDNYAPVAAQASNHINYFGVPGTAAGSADIFVVHCELPLALVCSLKLTPCKTPTSSPMLRRTRPPTAVLRSPTLQDKQSASQTAPTT